MPAPSRDVPSRFNLQQKWPAAERAWLKAAARRIGVSETNLLVAMMRREMVRGGEDPVPIDGYLPEPGPRSERGKRMGRPPKPRSPSGPSTEGSLDPRPS